jgi:TRAP-type C4-dicarboxylate transport system permease small subunit
MQPYRRIVSLKTLENLAKLCAILAGLLLVFITLMTVVSVVGRDTIGKTIVGDFELSGAAAGAAIALFMPWCQFKRGNIMVDFFTSKASEAAQDKMERFGALMLALVMALMTWRTALGGLNAWTTQSGTMMLGFPEWVVYCAMVPSLALTVLIALYQTVFGFAPDSTEANPELAV